MSAVPAASSDLESAERELLQDDNDKSDWKVIVRKRNKRQTPSNEGKRKKGSKARTGRASSDPSRSSKALTLSCSPEVAPKTVVSPIIRDLDAEFPLLTPKTPGTPGNPRTVNESSGAHRKSSDSSTPASVWKTVPTSPGAITGTSSNIWSTIAMSPKSGMSSPLASSIPRGSDLALRKRNMTVSSETQSTGTVDTKSLKTQSEPVSKRSLSDPKTSGRPIAFYPVLPLKKLDNTDKPRHRKASSVTTLRIVSETTSPKLKSPTSFSTPPVAKTSDELTSSITLSAISSVSTTLKEATKKDRVSINGGKGNHPDTSPIIASTSTNPRFAKRGHVISKAESHPANAPPTTLTSKPEIQQPNLSSTKSEPSNSTQRLPATQKKNQKKKSLWKRKATRDIKKQEERARSQETQAQKKEKEIRAKKMASPQKMEKTGKWLLIRVNV